MEDLCVLSDAFFNVMNICIEIIIVKDTLVG